jgi:O-antigen/teichoic acid export membrane protein
MAGVRGRRVILSGAAGLGVRLVSVASMLVTVPVILRTLGEERYGLLMTITAALSMAGLADLGVSNGLVSMLAEAHGRADHARVRGLVSSSWLSTWASALVVVAAFALLSPCLSWAGLLNARGALAAAQAGPALAMAVILVGLGMPAGIIQRIYGALQEGFIGSAWMAGGSLLSVVFTFLAAWLGLGLPAFVCAALGGGLVAHVGASVFEFTVRRPALRPSIGFASRKLTKELLTRGLPFLVLQLTVLTMNAADNLIIARMLGPQAVTSYSIASKLFIVAPVLLGTFLGPLWPAYADAMTRGDATWIRRTLRKSILLAVVVPAGVGAVALVFGPWLLSVWVGSPMGTTPLLLAGLAMWGVTSSMGSALSMLLNGLQVLRFQAVAALVTAIATIAAKVWAVDRWGLVAIPWAQVLAHGLFALLPSALIVHRALRGLQSRGDG